jgi:hypothetical protein
MSLIRFIVILSIGTILSWLTWTVVIVSLDPYTGGGLALLLFYVSSWLAALGTITIIGFFLRAWWEKESVYFRQVATALRQGALISTGATIALLLQGARWLNIWSGISLVLLVLVTEMFFLAGQARRPVHPDQRLT